MSREKLAEEILKLLKMNLDFKVKLDFIQELCEATLEKKNIEKEILVDKDLLSSILNKKIV